MDPHIVMGGFPVGPQFRNYSADATAFVVTYPVDSRPEGRERALAWEAAFVELAKGKLSAMAAAANLTLSFSSERSVQVGLGVGVGWGWERGYSCAGGQCWCRWWWWWGSCAPCIVLLLLLLQQYSTRTHAATWPAPAALLSSPATLLPLTCCPLLHCPTGRADA